VCQLYLAVAKIIKGDKRWDPLAPATYFAGPRAGYITKGMVKTYTTEMKEVFLELLRDGTLTGQGFEQLVLALQQFSASEGGAKTEDNKFSPPARVEATGGDEPKEPSGPSDFRTMNKRSSYLQGANMFRLCRSLDELQYLPALVFNFSRKEIELMLRRLVKELKDQQYQKYYGDEEATYKSKKIMERRQAEYKAKMTAYEQALKANASKGQEAKAARKENDGEGGKAAGGKESVDASADMMMAEPEPPIDIADEIDLEFSFHSPKALGQWQEDISDLMHELRRRMPKGATTTVLLDGLQRGIGMHHEGCRTQYRQAVEILFRRGYLRVVFATGTLALGINMPCRSTIFCGDSLDLNGLMFRQMSGRAGRRGFDLLGQVVFLDMSFLKVRRLIASDLSTLTGEFQLSPTTLLRVLKCWEQCCLDAEQDKALPRSKDELARTWAPMFSLPFFNSATAELGTQVAYHTRFSVELLRKEGLIDNQGGPRSFSSLVTHLFEVEPANFILSRLLSSGLLHEYLKAEEKNVIRGERKTHLTVKLTTVLARFLFRRRLPSNFAKSQPRKKWLPSEDCPALPPLPQKIHAELNAYNDSVLELFQELAFSVASTRKFGEQDFLLPVSRRRFQDAWDARGNGGSCFQKESEFQKCFIKQLVRFRARSPLDAISGCGDRFRSPNDLVTTLRNVIQMDLNSLPIVPRTQGADGAASELEATNSWILDFMLHGKMKYLAEDNGIDSTRAYKLISGFKDKIAMATAALKAYSPADDIVLKTFEQLHADLQSRLGGEKGK